MSLRSLLLTLALCGGAHEKCHCDSTIVNFDTQVQANTELVIENARSLGTQLTWSKLVIEPGKPVILVAVEDITSEQAQQLIATCEQLNTEFSDTVSFVIINAQMLSELVQNQLPTRTHVVCISGNTLFFDSSDRAGREISAEMVRELIAGRDPFVTRCAPDGTCEREPKN